MRLFPSVLVLLALRTACASAQVAPPPYVQAAEAARPEPPTPAAAPAEWLLAFIDVETTGLVPGWHEMIDIGIAMTDVDGDVVDTLFLRIHPRHPERLSAGARAVNAFDAGRWKTLGALAPEAAVDSILAFHRRVAGSRPTLMVAFNSQFDAAFLDHLFRMRGSSWREMYHYFVLDHPFDGMESRPPRFARRSPLGAAEGSGRAARRRTPHGNHRRHGERPHLPGVDAIA